MLGFGEYWGEHGRGLGMETSRAHIQWGSRPETLKRSKRWVQETIQMTGESKKREHCKGD